MPYLANHLLPVPVAGRFLQGSRGDLGLWRLRSGMIKIQNLATGRNVEFK